jgi:hypothetical protein
LVATYNGPDGATAANVLHFVSIGGDYDQSSGDTIAEEWGAFFEVYSQENWSIDTTLEWFDLSEDPPDVLAVTTDGNNGDSTSPPLPANVAACLSLASSSGGRSGRGRIYLPGIADEYVGGSLLTVPFISATLAAYTAFATSIAGGVGWVPAVYSRTDGLSRVVTSTGMSNVVDTQRRRTQRLEA